MPKIELIYDLDCPNVAATRATLMRAFSLAGLPAAWTEWERGGANAPEHVRQFGSPAILMDGRDIGGRPPNPAASCRLYRNADGVASGVPSVELIVQALQKGVPLRRGDRVWPWCHSRPPSCWLSHPSWRVRRAGQPMPDCFPPWDWDSSSGRNISCH